MFDKPRPSSTANREQNALLAIVNRKREQMVHAKLDPARWRNNLGRLMSGATIGIIVAGLLVSCGGTTAQQVAPTPTPLPAQPQVEKPSYAVQRGDIVEELQLSGRVGATKEDSLSFAQQGNVANIYVRATEPITKGRLLAELDLGEKLNQFKQAQIALDQAKLALQRGQAKQKFAVQLAQLDLEEAQTKQKQATAPEDRQLADIAVRRAQINLEQARQITDEDLEKQVATAQLAYEGIKAQVDAGRLYAPYDGQVAGVAVQPGAAVEAYKPVLSVMDPRQREIRVDSVVSTDLQRLSAKQPVTLRFSRYPDQPVKGVVQRLPGGATGAGGAPADPSLHISYDPGKLDLDIGDLAQVIVTLQRKEKVLWLPPQAIRTFQGRRFVVIEGEGGRQRRVDVKLGIESADKVEIVEGLKEGQKVIGQ